MTTAPGMKFDGGKLPYHLIDDDAEAEMVAVLGFGVVKYEPGNWAEVEGAQDRYYSAIRRHLRHARQGLPLDPETGLFALASAACDVHFLLALELRKHRDLAATLPERYARALKVAAEIRAKRLAAADAAALTPLDASLWAWEIVRPGGRVSAGGNAFSRKEALSLARAAQTRAGLRAAKIRLTEMEDAPPAAPPPPRRAKKKQRRR